jgi:N6-L-threonylcarbamoyladenine synthase
MACVLAIETSCDETAVAIVKNRTCCSSIVASQIPVHRQYGGVVPEVASRSHVETINQAIAQAFVEAQLDWGQLTGLPRLVPLA